MDYSLKKTVQLTILLKASLLTLIFLSYHFLPFNFENERGNSLGSVSSFSFASTLTTWDAQHYLFLADHGYAPGQMSNAFYPLLPYLIKLFSFLFLNNTLLGGLILSHGLTLLAMVLLYRLVQKRHGEKIAFYTCLFLLAFPTGFYLGLIYSESLFLLLSISLFYFMDGKNWSPALLCAVLLPLSRPTGLLLLAPILLGLVNQEYFKGNQDRLRKWLVPLGVVAGYTIYLAWMKVLTGDCFVAAHSEKYFQTNYSMGRLFHPVEWFLFNFVWNDFSVAGLHSGILNRILFLGFLATLPWVWRSLNKALFGYVLVLGLAQALSGDFASYMRYLIVLFPLFMVLAQKWKDNPEYYLLACLPLQGLFCVAHSLYNWVA